MYTQFQCLPLYVDFRISATATNPMERKVPKARSFGVSNRYSLKTPKRKTIGSTAIIPKGLSLQDFEIGRVLGKGKLGKVYCAKYKQAGFIVALKVMSKKDLLLQKLELNFRREIEIQASLIHPNISRLFNCFYDRDNVYLVLEFSVYGELYHHLKKCRRFNNNLASYYIYQITNALIYLHQKKIIHRDIKPENILLSIDNIVKLSDFGWSVKQKSKRITVCGTLDYLPPEMVENREHDYRVDIWSLGVLCFEFLTGKPPFEESDRNVTYKRIRDVDLVFPTYLNPDAKDLIQKLIQKDPKNRLPLDDVLCHPWIVKNKSSWESLTSKS